MKKLIFYPFYAYAMKIYHKDKDYEKANKFYQIAERFCPNHVENLFKIGMCYKKCRNYREASKYFEKALELDSENEKYKEQLQIARMRDFILFAPTKLWWQEIIALEQKIEEKGEKYELLLNLAENCLAMRHYDKAAEAYQRAITLCKEKDTLPQLYYEMGYAYENVADEVHLQLAREAYAQAITLDEELESKRYGIGVFHCAKERWRFANRAFVGEVESLAPRHCEDDRTKQSIIPHTCDSAIASLRGTSEANDEAIHHQAYFQDSTMKSQEARFHIIDCHENQRFSRNDEKPTIVSLREISETNDEASVAKATDPHLQIHNTESHLKASITESRVDKIMDCHDSLRNLAMTGKPNSNESNIIDCYTDESARNDGGSDSTSCNEAGVSDSRHCERSEAIYHQAYFQDSIAETKGEISDNGLPQPLTRLRNDAVASSQKSDIIDCHDSLRNLAMTENTSASLRGTSEANDEAIHNPAYPKAPDDLLLNKVGESFERLYDWENALKYYQQSLELNYQNPQTHLRLGFVYERMGNYRQAVESYKQGLQRNSASNAYWVYRLGFCLNQLGEFQEASKTLLNLQVTNAYPLLVGGGG